MHKVAKYLQYADHCRNRAAKASEIEEKKALDYKRMVNTKLIAARLRQRVIRAPAAARMPPTPSWSYNRARVGPIASHKLRGPLRLKSNLIAV
jgi:hypothetical protein